MPKGGPREGEAGKAYPNRTDLAMSGGTSTHMAGGQSGMRGSGTSNTELQSQSAAPPSSAGSTGSAPSARAAGPAPGGVTPLDAAGGGGSLLDMNGRQSIFPRDQDAVIRQLYRMTGSLDLLELLERRAR